MLTCCGHSPCSDNEGRVILVQVNHSWDARDYVGARRNSYITLSWNIAAIVGGIVCAIIGACIIVPYVIIIS